MGGPDLPEEVDGSIPGTLTETALRLPPGLPFERWLEVGRTLRRISRSIQWWVGDWLAYGEDTYGEEAFAELERQDKTLANWAYTCRRIPPSRRRENLSYSHHAEVAPLSPEKQDLVLKRAERDCLSVRQVREEVRRIQEEEAEKEFGPARRAREIPCPYCGGTGRVLEEEE